MTDTINPSHYQHAKWQAIDVMEDVLDAVSENGNPKAAYNVAAALKYLLRAGRKGDTREQVLKAEWHIKRAVNLLSKTDSLPMAQNVQQDLAKTAIGKADMR